MKKHLLLITAMLFSIAIAFAQGGTTGPLAWNLENDTLTIRGEGAMPDYKFYAPWVPSHGSPIHTIIIKEGVTSIGEYAFNGCENLVSIVIPNSVKSIGVGAFYSCRKLLSFTIPINVTRIERETFHDCTGLTSIIIPESVTNIEKGAFHLCSNLLLIINQNSVPFSVKPEAFSGLDQSVCQLRVPSASVSEYRKAKVWKEFIVLAIE